jgi:hypothetical protein
MGAEYIVRMSTNKAIFLLAWIYIWLCEAAQHLRLKRSQIQREGGDILHSTDDVGYLWAPSELYAYASRPRPKEDWSSAKSLWILLEPCDNLIPSISGLQFYWWL